MVVTHRGQVKLIDVAGLGLPIGCEFLDPISPQFFADIVTWAAIGARDIVGVMLESFLVEGRQDLHDKAALVYGQSITDSCMGWETTIQVLGELAAAVQAWRRL